MRSQNRKVNNVGRAGCLGLLALGLMLVSPVGSSSVFAEEVGDYGTDTQEDVPSTVEIAFMPAIGSATLSPTTATGQSAQINVLARVNVQNSGGYSVYLKSNSQNLVGQKNENNIIPGATTAKTYNAMDVNTWGYYAGEGSSVPEGVTYKAISVSGNGDKVVENANNKIKADTKNIMLSFAAKINDEKPADTYQNTVTMSVVSSPLQTTLTDITDMQNMTSAICSASAMYETKQLKDVRDGKFYWVTKLADNRCWMTQNLDLDLDLSTEPDENSAATNTVKEFTNIDTDLNSQTSWSPNSKTFGVVNASNIVPSNIGQRSWSLGDYRITNPDVADSCGSNQNSAADCPSQFTAYTTPTDENKDMDAHYILGNHYQWSVATAGSSDTLTSGPAEDSICPRGWRLPTSGSGGEFETLVTALGGTSSTDNITKAPFYGVRGGYINQSASSLFETAGSGGRYWSATALSGGNAHLFDFAGTASVSPLGAWGRYLALSVRCIAR